MEQELNIGRIIGQETDDFFEENTDNIFVKIINLDEYPIAYYTSENMLDTLAEKDALACFNNELSKKIKTVSSDTSLKNFIVERYYFQYIMNHFGNDADALKVVVNNMFDADVVIVTYRHYIDQTGIVTKTIQSFINTIKDADHNVLKSRRPLASVVKFQVQPIETDKYLFKMNEEYIRDRYEFDLFNNFIKLGFIFIPDFYISILEQPSGNIIDAIKNSFIGESFTHLLQKQLYNKINSMVSNIVTIKG